ncbi:MAG: hypothetical protein AAFO94_15620, partial [Bacteroidota bacterium]
VSYGESKPILSNSTHFAKAKNNNETIDYPFGLCNSYLGLAKVQAHQKAYDKALRNALKGKAIAAQLKLTNYHRDAAQLSPRWNTNTSTNNNWIRPASGNCN